MLRVLQRSFNYSSYVAMVLCLNLLTSQFPYGCRSLVKVRLHDAQRDGIAQNVLVLSDLCVARGYIQVRQKVPGQTPVSAISRSQ